jgi:hypothetical protein
MTEKLFAQAVKSFKTLFFKSPSNAAIKIYWQQLKNIPDDLWEQGIQRCVNTCTFFPAITELGGACLREHLHEREEKFDWPMALERVLEKRRRPKQPAVKPPPNRDEAKAVLKMLVSKLEDLDAEKQGRDAENRLLREEQRKQQINARRLQLGDQARSIENAEPRDDKTENHDRKWIH